MEVWKVGKTFLIHHSSSMLWEMIVSNVTYMKTEYIRLKHAKWVVWSFKSVEFFNVVTIDSADYPECLILNVPFNIQTSKRTEGL
ncbi:hypothetical protein LDENG_00264830 [Lucifuga dentata]|nr:hypothetical protein LDENG_00264830 [Lucifuga dentata]